VKALSEAYVIDEAQPSRDRWVGGGTGSGGGSGDGGGGWGDYRSVRSVP
jgi:hypothetical protein